MDEELTLVIHWVFSWLALLIMGSRLGWRKVAKQDFNMGDYLTMAAMVCALTRIGMIHVVLTWGTSNVPPELRESHAFTDREIYQRVVGSKLSIANRFFYNSYLWLQKLVLLDVYRRIMADLPWEKWTMRGFLFVFLVTYIVVQVTNVSECSPVSLYWQVTPDPGPCAQAQVQLIVLGVLNIVTDVMLIILPIPVIITWNTAMARKLRLYLLFALGVFIVAITAIRLPINVLHKDSQDNRTIWATTELLTAAIVVNAPTLYGLWNLRQHQKSTTKGSDGREFWHPDSHGLSASAAAGESDGETFSLDTRRKKPESGILQTKVVTMSSVRHTHTDSGDAERASVHSSERGILRDS